MYISFMKYDDIVSKVCEFELLNCRNYRPRVMQLMEDAKGKDENWVSLVEAFKRVIAALVRVYDEFPQRIFRKLIHDEPM